MIADEFTKLKMMELLFTDNFAHYCTHFLGHTYFLLLPLIYRQSIYKWPVRIQVRINFKWLDGRKNIYGVQRFGNKYKDFWDFYLWLLFIHPFFSSFLSLSLVLFFSFYYMHNTWLVDVFTASELVLPYLIFVVEDAFTASMSSLLTSCFHCIL